jgi:hypothetical protein
MNWDGNYYLTSLKEFPQYDIEVIILVEILSSEKRSMGTYVTTGKYINGKWQADIKSNHKIIGWHYI